MSTKIVKLTALNVEALNLIGSKVSALVETTKTTATFVGLTAYEALGIVQRMQDKAATDYGKTSGPYQALNAVRRKVLTLAEAEQANEDRMRVESVRDSGVLAEGLAAAKARSGARAEQDAANDPLIALLDSTTPVAPSDTDAEALVSVAGFAPGELDGSLRRRPNGGLVILAGEPEPKRQTVTVIPTENTPEGVNRALAEAGSALRIPMDTHPRTRSHASVVSLTGARVHAAVSDAAIVKAMAGVMRQATAGTAVFEEWFMAQSARSGRVAGLLLPLSKTGQRRPKRSRRG